MATGKDLVSAARQLIGTKFHHQGRVTAGVDCLGLVALACKNIGVGVVDKTDYPRQSQGNELREHLLQQCDLVDERVAGCILHFRWGRSTQHVAVWTGDGTVVHAVETFGKVIENRLADDWEAAITGVYWIKELEKWQ